MEKDDKIHEIFKNGMILVEKNRIFARLLRNVEVSLVSAAAGGFHPSSHGVVKYDGSGRPQILANKGMRNSPAQWAYVIAHHLLHLGFGHFYGPPGPDWNLACDLTVARFLRDIRFGTPPDGLGVPAEQYPLGERKILDWILGLSPGACEVLKSASLAGKGREDMVGRAARRTDGSKQKGFLLPGRSWGSGDADFEKIFAEGLADAVSLTIEVAANRESFDGGGSSKKTDAARAREWFMANFPLLGSLAASFKLVEDHNLCRHLQISVAAVEEDTRTIYFNPASGLREEEIKFVMAHEILHVGLRHTARRHGRDPFLWNVACDYVINHWLVEMGVGAFPSVGGMLDKSLEGLGATEIYDKIVSDIRVMKKVATLRGVGLGDMLPTANPDFWNSAEGISLDEFYRGMMAQGLDTQLISQRGLLPAGLIEEIRSLAMPPVPWDVKLGRWFNENFPPVETSMTYARPSRRQSATPDIPRPSRYTPEEAREGRTFAVVLDTSGSMSRRLVGEALGVVAAYALAHDVAMVRLVFCDARAYDQGYVSPEDISGLVKVSGRGGTVLQPAVDLIEAAADFPKDGPVLIITDGAVESFLRVDRRHAYVMPEGARLPFRPQGPVFHAIEDAKPEKNSRS